MHSTPIIEWKSGRYGNNRWFAYSPKAHRIVNLYSDLEYDHWVLAEFDPTIVTLCEQPRRIDGLDTYGARIESIFDMWCGQGNNEGFYIEVKYHWELDPSHPKYSSRSARQVEFQRNWCDLNGFRHVVRTDTDIYKNRTLLSNYKKMLPYIDDRRPIIETDLQRIKSSLKSRGTMSVSMITEDTKLPKQRVKDVIYRLIYTGFVESDVDCLVLGSETMVTLK